MRTTKAEIISLFKHLCEATGNRAASRHGDVGAWALDYAPVYGGWTIREYLKSGGEGEPFGSRRYSNSEFADVMRFALRALYLKSPAGKKPSGRYY